MYVISFCHAYNSDKVVAKAHSPALAAVDSDDLSIKDIYSLTFPRSPEDFSSEEFRPVFVGDKPCQDTLQAFKHLPRFGVTGLTTKDGLIYCASWNGVYVADNALKVRQFISNSLMSDLHGLDVFEKAVYTVTPALDLLVKTDIESGRVLDYIQIGNRLEVTRNPELVKYDWRFISKQRRGAVGLWHFNNVTIARGKIFLTSRLFSCMLEINLEMTEVRLRSFNWDTPVMIHDGIPVSTGGFAFTSVDGKIIEADDADNFQSSMRGMEGEDFHPLMKHDMNTATTRLHSILGREANWCRGLFEDTSTNSWVCTIDGRYDQDRPYFQVLRLGRGVDASNTLRQISYDSCEFPRDVRYMTGFDICEI